MTVHLYQLFGEKNLLDKTTGSLYNVDFVAAGENLNGDKDLRHTAGRAHN